MRTADRSARTRTVMLVERRRVQPTAVITV